VEGSVVEMVLAGDFNLVESTFPMGLLAGPYPAPHMALIPAELYHHDKTTTWTQRTFLQICLSNMSWTATRSDGPAGIAR
jgi:hypothetical protein